MNFRKVLSFFLIILLFACLFPSFSLGGVLADSSSPLYVIQTEYFDIIFPEECRETARKIEAVCDDYYLELTEKLETEAWQRFPVTITRSVEVLNAYFAAVPYNRIVLYDTLPEKNLDMMEDTILSVFYHELTHAVTYNMKGPLLKKLSFFADSLTPAWLSVTTFWAEGATVSFESRGRGGRLKDPFATQLANQSVIEGNFPSWRDVSGARDTFPGGNDAYIFGSMFASYLQEKYGMSRYAEFWKAAHSRLTLSFIAGVFKKTYGTSISEEWKQFEKSLEIKSSPKKACLLSSQKSRIPAFDLYYEKESGLTKIAYFDSLSASLRLVTLDSRGQMIKNKKLLAITGIVRVLFSSDGSKLALTRTIEKKNFKSVTALYDLKGGKYSEKAETGFRDAYFFSAGGKDDFFDVALYNDRKEPGSASYFCSGNEIPFSPVGISENLGGAIIKDGLKWKIRLFDGEKPFLDYDFSEISPGQEKKNLILHNLHLLSEDSEAIWLSFSWAELGSGGKMLSRSGFLKIERETMRARAFLQKENSFAGVIDSSAPFAAVSCLEDGGEKEKFSLVIVAAEYDRNPLYLVQMKKSDFDVVEVKAHEVTAHEVKSHEVTAGKNEAGQNLSEREIFEKPASDFEKIKQVEISYNPFRYYRHGIILPLAASLSACNFDLGTDSSLSLGFTFVSTNPWGDKRLTFSSGYNPWYKFSGLETGLSGGNDSFAYSLSGSCLFDYEGFMQTVESLSFSKVMWRGKVSSFSAGLQGKFLYGKQLTDEKIAKNRDDSVGKSADGLIFLKFSSIHKIAPDLYAQAGFSFMPFLLSSYRNTEKQSSDDKYVNAGAQAQVRFPIFLPFIFTASLFPSSKYAASGSVKAILADFEIHKGIPALSVFIQRLVISAGYSGKLSYNHGEAWDCKDTAEIFAEAKKSDYSDSVSLSAQMQLSPNTGFMASGDFIFSLGYTVLYRPNPKASEKRLAWGITFGVNY